MALIIPPCVNLEIFRARFYSRSSLQEPHISMIRTVQFNTLDAQGRVEADHRQPRLREFFRISLGLEFTKCELLTLKHRLDDRSP